MVLRASITTIDPVVSVTTQTPAVSIDYILLTVSVVLDASGRFRIVFDAVAVTESLSLAITKGFLDTALVTDAPVFATTRPVFDSVLAQEAFDRQVDFLRSFTDTAVAQELIAKEITRPDVTDFVVVADQQVLALGKNLVDAVVLLEGIDRFDFIKSLQDQVTALDALTAIGKDKILDVTTTVDSITTLATTKVTDPDAVTAQDAAVFTPGKGLVDSADVADAINTFFTQKALAHSVSMADNFVFELILGDSIPVYEFAFIADSKFTAFPVPGTVNSHLVHEPLVNGEFVLTTDPNAGIVYTIRVESDSYMFSGYTLNGDQLN